MRITSYIEGAENFGQALARPLTIFYGSSYDRNNKKYCPSLRNKVALVALAIIFLPLSVPLIMLGCLMVAVSENHKKRFHVIQLGEAGTQAKVEDNLNIIKAKLEEAPHASSANDKQIIADIGTFTDLRMSVQLMQQRIEKILGLLEGSSLKGDLQEPLNVLRTYV